MKENERLTTFYNLDSIAGQAVREAEARKVLDNLDCAFEGNLKELPVNTDIQQLIMGVEQLIRGVFYSGNLKAVISKPIDSFTYQEQTIETCVTRISLEETKSWLGANIYLLALIGSGQSNLSVENIPFGVVITSDDQREFFKIEREETENCVQFNAVKLAPDEQYLIVEELKKISRDTDS